MTQQLEAMKLALEALEAISGSQDNPNIGWRGGGTDKLFACEYCKQVSEDCSKIPHLHKCPVPKAYPAITALRQSIEQAQKQEPVAKVISTAPKQIWLDLGFDPSDEDEISFNDLCDATWSHDNAIGYGIEYVRADLASPPQRQPQFREFIKWAGAQGYDCGQTCNSDTGEWICLHPMTADLWKCWQAAHGIGKGEA